MRNKKVVLTSVNKSDSKYTPEVRRAFFDKETHVMTVFCSIIMDGSPPGLSIAILFVVM